MDTPSEFGGSRQQIVDGFVVDVVPLLRWPGNQAEVRLDEPAHQLATSAAEVMRVQGTVVAESMSDSLRVSGPVYALWRGQCRRCLEDATGATLVEVDEIYERNPVEGETYRLAGEKLDLEPMIREVVLLSLPLAPLCSDDCAGPAPDRFPATVESDPASAGAADADGGDDAKPVGDPRWAALDAITFDDNS